MVIDPGHELHFPGIGKERGRGHITDAADV